jgi:serine/threonine protein kinase
LLRASFLGCGIFTGGALSTEDLKPDNILIDWDWTIRIGDFSHSLLADASGAALADKIATLSSNLSLNAHYIAS